ncbi:DUF881 domain-containing protein [Nocardioides sp.]|jgi:uncharacterized protein YlxW (UPF0749 family)|uniref:DUF881 domain-containing protein n=1 Tax=Nocardioides sp. TaxID=35761 RepID=UPI002F410453
MPENPESQHDPDRGGARTPSEARGSADEVGLQRLRAALFRPSRAQLVVGVLLAVLGFAAITQVRTNNTNNSYAGYREQDLVDVLSALAGTSQHAQNEIDGLESTRRQLEQNRQAQSAALAAAAKQAQELSILAGSVPVTGPGIRLTVTEGPRPVDVDSVLDAIEELRSAGAEAMQVNGEVRLVAQSAVESAPGGLRIDGTLVTSPYVFDVIGDPHTLSGALNLVDGPIAQFKDADAAVNLVERDSLDITSVRQPTAPQFAQSQ